MVCGCGAVYAPQYANRTRQKGMIVYETKTQKY